MNSFIQEYGRTIVAVIVVLAFIVFASVFGDTITTGIKDITSDFFTKSGVTADVNGGGDGAGGTGGSGDSNTNDDSQYQLSGTWIFNNTLTAPKTEYLREYVRFSQNGYGYCGIIVDQVYGDPINLYYDDLGDPNTMYEFEDYYSNMYWNDSSNRTVNFGSTPQEVSQEFYEWFTANATKTDTGSAAGHPTPQ